MPDELVNVRTDGPVAVVEMAAGKANALDWALCRQLAVRFAVGTHRLSGLIMSGRTYAAADAAGLGLVDDAVEGPGVLARAIEVARGYAGLHQPAVRQARRQIRGPVLASIAAQASVDDAVHAIWRSLAVQQSIRSYAAQAIRRSS